MNFTHISRISSICQPHLNISNIESTIKEPNHILFAPGEGKVPESFLNSDNWDIKAFPMKHPDGKNGLHQDRPKKLSDQYYFVQRLRNKDQK